MTRPPATSPVTAHDQLEQAWSLRRTDPEQARAIALAFHDDPELSPQARVVLNFLAYDDGQRAALLPVALATAEALRGRDNPLWLARALGSVALLRQETGQRDLSLATLHEMLALTAQSGDLELRGNVLQDIGVLWYITDREKAAGYFRAAVEVLEQAGPEAAPSLSNTLINLGGLEYQAGRQEEGVSLIERGGALALSCGSLMAWAHAETYMAEVYTERGEAAVARARLQDALARFPELPGDTRQRLLRTAGIVEYLAGEYGRALDAFARLEGFELVQFDQQQLLQMKMDSLARLGRLDEAYALSQELLTFNEQLYRQERETQLLRLEERHQAEHARREAELKQRENAELQRALESNAILIQSLRESQLESETLLGVSHLTQLDLEPPDLARHALALVTRLVDADWCTLARLHSDELSFESVWARDEAAEAFARLTLPELLGARHALLQRSARQDEPTFVSGYQRDEAAHGPLVAAGLQGFASLPLGSALESSYVLLLGRLGQDRRWSQRERHVLGATGRALRAAVEAQERSRRSREAALTDVLTGLANRRAFEAQLRDVTGGTAFSVAMLDLDGLKRINDTRGHAAGDTLLQVFAASLRANAPGGLHPFRLGGDEFALLIGHDPATPREVVEADVLEVLDASVAAVRAAGFSEAGCSYGVARWPDDAPSAADVLACADARLYADKQLRKARRSGVVGVASVGETVSFGDAVLDLTSGELLGPLGCERLGAAEAQLLSVLASQAGQVVPWTVLAGGAGREDLDRQVSQLRRTLASVTGHAGIRTVDDQGFSLNWYGEP